MISCCGFPTYICSKTNMQYIFLDPSGSKREHVNKVRQPVKVEPKDTLLAQRAERAVLMYLVPEQSEGKQMILHNSSKARIAK